MAKEFETLFEQAYMTQNTETINTMEAMLRKIKDDLG